MTSFTGPTNLKAAFKKLYNITSRRLSKGMHFAGTPHALSYLRTAHTGYGAGTKLPCYNAALAKMGSAYYKRWGSNAHF